MTLTEKMCMLSTDLIANEIEVMVYSFLEFRFPIHMKFAQESCD